MPEATSDLRDAIVNFVNREIAPGVDGWEHESTPTDAWVAELGEMGFLDVGSPAGEGGVGLSGETVLVGEIAEQWGSLALAIVPSLLLSRLLRSDEAATGALWPVALATVGDGLSVTSASDDTVRVVGRLTAVVNGQAAGRLLLLPEGVGDVLLVELSPDTSKVHPRAYDGFRSLPHPDLEIDAAARTVASGRHAADLVAAHRILLAALATGLAAGALERTVRYLIERHQFRRPIGSFGEMQALAALAATQSQAADYSVAGAARAWDDGSRAPSIATRAVLFASSAAMDVSERAQHAFGGYGHMAEFSIGRFVRDSRMSAISAGPRAGLVKAVAVELGLPDHMRSLVAG
jgi:alkylation response protein AidB-like acyl-CoA dehydrogenase